MKCWNCESDEFKFSCCAPTCVCGACKITVPHVKLYCIGFHKDEQQLLSNDQNPSDTEE